MKALQEEHPSTGGTVGYFDAEAASWSARYQGKPHFQSRLETVLAWIADQRNSSGPLEILDYGCGSGVMLRALTEAGYRMTGVDASPGMLAAARQSLMELPSGKSAAERLMLAGADFEAHAASARYDGLICLGVLEYVPEPWPLLETLLQTVKPGGFLILSLPNRDSLLRRIEGLIHRLAFLFRPWGLFPHLTGPDNYLQFQHHQFEEGVLSRWMAAHGAARKRLRYHVAPGLPARLATHPGFGMTMLVEFTRHPAE